MCARPVQASVTVIVGHENVRNSSKDSKSTPHERSYLSNRSQYELLLFVSFDLCTYHGMLCSWK